MGRREGVHRSVQPPSRAQGNGTSLIIQIPFSRITRLVHIFRESLNRYTVSKVTLEESMRWSVWEFCMWVGVCTPCSLRVGLRDGGLAVLLFTLWYGLLGLCVED
jgi:uncharacterized membrane protein